jgi:hypothetical protein
MVLASPMAFSSLEEEDCSRVLLLVHWKLEVLCRRLQQASFHPCLFERDLHQQGVYRGCCDGEDDGEGDRLVSENNGGNEGKRRYKCLGRAL